MPFLVYPADDLLLPKRRWAILLFFLLFLPFFDFDIVRFLLSFSCGYYPVSSVSVSAATRLAYDMYLDTYVR